MNRTLSTLILGALFFLLAAPGFACDVDLANMLFGGKGDDAFIQTISRLASLTQSVGKAAENSDEAKANLKNLMNAWIEFDNRFSQKPPEWASQDTKWTAKIKTLTDLIGKIQKFLEESKVQECHVAVTELHRRILQLVETMPMPELNRKLLSVSGILSEMDAATLAQNFENLKTVTQTLQTQSSDLAGSVPDAQKKAATKFGKSVEKLNEALASGPASFTFQVTVLTSAVDDCFKKLNQSLSESSR